MVLPAHRTGNAGADGQPRFTATGKIPLESEYEYRMTAVAYSEEQGEKRLFELNDSYFNHAEITLLGKDEYKTPELFLVMSFIRIRIPSFVMIARTQRN